MSKKRIFGINMSLVIVLVAVALIGGISGTLISQFYLSDSPYTNPFSSELNLLQSGSNGPNLIIRDAKKVVVSQDVKVQETADNARESLVGLFVKQFQPTDLEQRDIKPTTNYYQLDQPRLTGVVITADGWIMLSGDGLKTLKELPGNYIVIDQDKEIYEIDEVIDIKGQPVLLAHLEGAENLKPMNFMKFSDLHLGQSLLALDWQDEQILTALTSIEEPVGLVSSSEEFFHYLSLADQLTNESEMFVFNLNGEAIAFYANDTWIPFSSYSFTWQSALSEEEMFLPFLGVNYINLSQVAQVTGDKTQGALIYPNTRGISVVKGSPADTAGLLAGDVVRAIDSTELNEHNDLAQVLSNYQGGQEIDLTILRGDVLEVKVITLGNKE